MLLDPLGESPPGALLSHGSATIRFSHHVDDDNDDDDDDDDDEYNGITWGSGNMLPDL